MSEPLTLALTIDDAPSIAAAPDVAFDPARMDVIRELLIAHGVQSCVAFVIGRHARGHEPALARWLEAGYELGNHTDDHAFASRTDLASYVASIARCDALLESVGAFANGRPRYFRFPYGDRGSTPSARATLLKACEDMGYTFADVSVELYDYCYEAQLARALAQAPERARAVETRYLASAVAALRRAGRLGRRRYGAEHVHVANAHFGLVTRRTLAELLARIAPHVRLVPLAAALAGPAYVRDASDLSANGIIAERLGGPFEQAVLRRLARAARRAGWFEQGALGPRWPHLTG